MCPSVARTLLGLEPFRRCDSRSGPTDGGCSAAAAHGAKPPGGDVSGIWRLTAEEVANSIEHFLRSLAIHLEKRNCDEWNKNLERNITELVDKRRSRIARHYKVLAGLEDILEGKGTRVRLKDAARNHATEAADTRQYKSKRIGLNPSRKYREPYMAKPKKKKRRTTSTSRV